MYGRKACQLVKEVANSEKGQLTPFSSDLFAEVIEECKQHYHELECLIRRMEEQGLNVETAKNEDHYGALIHHLALVRNKRCLMAYVYNRAENLRTLMWKVGSVFPEEIKEKLSYSEKEYITKHSESLKKYMSTVELNLEVDMVPPKDPYIKVRVLDDLGGEILLSHDKKANFTCHSMHFLKRTDAEQFISQVGEDLSEGEAQDLLEYGWEPNTGPGTMLKYYDRVVHDRKNESDSSEWRSKIGKMLMDGYTGRTLVTNIPKKVLECREVQCPEIKLRVLITGDLCYSCRGCISFFYQVPYLMW